jgi:hypothetical protein
MTEAEWRDQSDRLAGLIRELGNRIEHGCESVCRRFDAFHAHLDARFAVLDGRLDRIETQISNFNKTIPDRDRLMTQLFSRLGLSGGPSTTSCAVRIVCSSPGVRQHISRIEMIG